MFYTPVDRYGSVYCEQLWNLSLLFERDKFTCVTEHNYSSSEEFVFWIVYFFSSRSVCVFDFHCQKRTSEENKIHCDSKRTIRTPNSNLFFVKKKSVILFIAHNIWKISTHKLRYIYCIATGAVHTRAKNHDLGLRERWANGTNIAVGIFQRLSRSVAIFDDH